MASKYKLLATKLNTLNVLKTAKKMIENNRGINGEQCKRNDNDLMAVSNENKLIAWKSYHEKLLKNSEFAWDRNSLPQVDAVSNVPYVMKSFD